MSRSKGYYDKLVRSLRPSDLGKVVRIKGSRRLPGTIEGVLRKIDGPHKAAPNAAGQFWRPDYYILTVGTTERGVPWYRYILIKKDSNA